MAKDTKRLLSLDILRGITIAGMLLVNNPGTWSHIYAPLEHAEWIGLTPTDLVFPFFMFVMGVSMYFSLRKFHFKPSKDSIRIYAVFIRFLISSLSSSVVDIVLFSIFCALFKSVPVAIGYIMLSTILARVISAIYNFLINYKVVFKGKGNGLRAAVRYLILAVCIMLLSGFLVSFFHGMIPDLPEALVKIPVDCVLFLLSFIVQREVVYK